MLSSLEPSVYLLQLNCSHDILINSLHNFRYPDETMKTVAELSEDIIGEFRDRQKTRLQRTFVGAADAASAKVNRK